VVVNVRHDGGPWGSGALVPRRPELAFVSNVPTTWTSERSTVATRTYVGSSRTAGTRRCPLVARRKDDRVPREPRRECAAQDRDSGRQTSAGRFPPKGPRVARRGTRTARGYSTSTPRSRDPSGCCCDEASGRKRSSTVSPEETPPGRARRGTPCPIPKLRRREIPAWSSFHEKARSRRAAVRVSARRPGVTDSQRLGPGVSVPRRRGIHGPSLRLSRRTGYGRASRRISDRDLGGGDMKDIIAGGRWLIETGKCAPDRLGAIWRQLRRVLRRPRPEQAPNLWAVGVSIVGYFNWSPPRRTSEPCSDKTARRWVAPTRTPDLFRKFSPITTSTASAAPVFFHRGAYCTRCPVSEARAMVEEMRRWARRGLPRVSPTRATGLGRSRPDHPLPNGRPLAYALLADP